MIDGREATRKLFLNLARYSGLAPALSPLLSGIGAILMLHRVNDEPATELGLNTHLTITPAFLDRVLGTLRRAGYHLVSMDEAVDRIRADRHRERFVAITLDDGYLDNFTEALPVFEAHDAPFTVYVAPALVDGRVGLWWEMLEEIVTGRDWLAFETPQGRVSMDCSTPARKVLAAQQLKAYLTNDVEEQRQGEVLNDLGPVIRVGRFARASKMMGWEEIRAVAAHRLGTIGAHTIHHYNLRRLSRAAAEREIRECARIIRIETGAAPRHFAYPYGDAAAAGPREMEIAAGAGYLSAVTTRHGVIRRGHRDHLHALPRISLNGRYQKVGHVRTMLSGLTTVANSRRGLVTL